MTTSARDQLVKTKGPALRGEGPEFPIYDVNLEEVVDPVGPSDAALWVISGGGWFSSGWGCRSSNRYGFDAAGRCSELGLRVARVPSGE
jgi:formylglycine-generating enzyme required for sulfatase activity